MTKAYGRCAAFGLSWTVTAPTFSMMLRPLGAPWALQCHALPSHQLTCSFESRPRTKTYGRWGACGSSFMVTAPAVALTPTVLVGLCWSFHCHEPIEFPSPARGSA